MLLRASVLCVCVAVCECVVSVYGCVYAKYVLLCVYECVGSVCGCVYAEYATVCECVVCVWLHVGVW